MKKPARRRTAEKQPPSPPAPEVFPVVAVGASAGGLEALTDLLRYLPVNTNMAYVVVQHLDPTHSSKLAEILGRATPMPVAEVSDGLKLQKGHLYVIPANKSMVIVDNTLKLTPREPMRRHMPIDYFFESLALERAGKAVGVILSGTGSDGGRGCRAMKAAGGITFAQDEESAKYTDMPRNAVLAGCVDFVLPAREIAQELVRLEQHPYVALSAGKDDEALPITEREQLHALFSIVRDLTGVDFAHYKQSTVNRRIKRRLVVHRLETIREYLEYVREHPAEVDELFRDILIHVTGFFRDPGVFEALKRIVLPEILRGRKRERGAVRVWVPGCSTGEEVYSIAMLLLEYLWEQARQDPSNYVSATEIQLFGTDVSDSPIERARTGLYTEAALDGVSPERLKRFFERHKSLCSCQHRRER